MAESLRVTGKSCTNASPDYRVDEDPNESPVQVLVVDDYEPFRRFVCSMLKGMPELQVIGEAADGFAAVQKAKELRPDLILLDIGLPGLNGMEAARRIRVIVPECRIVFLSLESSAEVVQEAFKLGALSYIVKEHIAGELLSVVEAVVLDKFPVRKSLKS